MTETIGKQLKNRREARNLTIAKVAQATRVRPYFIEAMEADDFDALPSPVQARGFLRMYADFLGLTMDELVANAREDTEPSAAQTFLVAPPEPQEVPSEITITAEPADSETTQPEPVAAEAFDTRSARLKTWWKKAVEAVQPWVARLRYRHKQVTEPPSPETGSGPRPEPEPNLPAETDEPVPAEPMIAPSEETPTATPQSVTIFTVIGKQLQQQRQMLSLTLEEIERQTHVRKYYLEAMEAGEFNLLPTSVQARGMLNNFAHFLNMDVDVVLLRFAEGLQAQRLERQPKPIEKPQQKNPWLQKFHLNINIPPSIRRYLSVDLIVGGGLILLLLIFAIWGTGRVIALRSAPTPQTTAPSISDILLASPNAGESPTPMRTPTTGPVVSSPINGQTPMAIFPTAGAGQVQVVVIALERTWVRVVVDGKIEFEGRVIPGTAYPYNANQQIEVLTGNGGTLQIIYNQKDMGVMGGFGEVVDRIYTADAVLKPTPTSTPSPTPTPRVTSTSNPTPTQTLGPVKTP